MLSKYHSFLDHFHDLKTTLQAEFDLLKKATSKNVQNIQEAVQSQQAYTTALCDHINSPYAKLAQLDKQVQIHCLYPHPQSDVVQLNAPEYDLDIDEQLDPVTDVQSLNAETVKEDTPQIPPSQNTTLPFPQIPTGLNLSPQKFQQILTTQCTMMVNNQEQNTLVITIPNWKTSQN